MKQKIESTSESGFTLLEVIVAIMVVAILGTATLSLISTSGTVYKKIQYDYNAENEARIALSYITIKVRQNDFTYGPAGNTVNSVKLIDADGAVIESPDEHTVIGSDYLKIISSDYLDESTGYTDISQAKVWVIAFSGTSLVEYYYDNEADYIDHIKADLKNTDIGDYVISVNLHDDEKDSFQYDPYEKLLSFTITYAMTDGAHKTLDGMVYLRSE